MKNRIEKTLKIRKYTKLIEEWSTARKLHNADPNKQLLKLYEEFGELAEGLAKDKSDLIKDSLGDIFVVLVIFAQQNNYVINDYEIPPKRFFTEFNKALTGLANDIAYIADNHAYYAAVVDCVDTLVDLSEVLNINLADCIELAYEEIKDRKGEMRNGIFVKESDL